MTTDPLRTTIRVIPLDLPYWHLAVEGAFILVELPKAAPIVDLEHYRSSAFPHDSQDVNDHSNAITPPESDDESHRVQWSAFLAAIKADRSA